MDLSPSQERSYVESTHLSRPAKQSQFPPPCRSEDGRSCGSGVQNKANGRAVGRAPRTKQTQFPAGKDPTIPLFQYSNPMPAMPNKANSPSLCRSGDRRSRWGPIVRNKANFRRPNYPTITLCYYCDCLRRCVRSRFHVAWAWGPQRKIPHWGSPSSPWIIGRMPMPQNPTGRMPVPLFTHPLRKIQNLPGSRTTCLML